MIRSRITSRGEITGRFSVQEAADLALVLRSGSFAVPVLIEEERPVGRGREAEQADQTKGCEKLATFLNCQSRISA